VGPEDLQDAFQAVAALDVLGVIVLEENGIIDISDGHSDASFRDI
jgi:hypothetical protein